MADDYQVGVPVDGRLNEPVGRVAVRNDVFSLDSSRLKAGRRLSGKPFTLRVQIGLAGQVSLSQSRALQPRVPLRIGVCDAEDLDVGAMKDRPPPHDFNRSRGVIGPIDADQDSCDPVTTRDKDRAATRVRHLFGYGPEDGRLKWAAAAVAQDDQIEISGRLIQDCRGGSLPDNLSLD